MSLPELTGVTEQVSPSTPQPSLDTATPSTTDRLTVISLSPLTCAQIFIRALCSQSSERHQQSSATRTGAQWRLQRPWEDESNDFLPACLLYSAVLYHYLKTHKAIILLLLSYMRGFYILHIISLWLFSNSLQAGSNTTLNSWIHICFGQQHCWWAQTVMWHLNILIKNACLEGKQRGALGAPARED